MMRQPLALLALLFSAGIIFAKYIRPPFVFTYFISTAVFLACVLMAKRRVSYIILVFILVFLIGSLRYVTVDKRLNKALAPAKPLLSLKANMQSILYRYLPCVPASIVEAMVLGEKEKISPNIYNSMMKTGTVHILVVSGFNVGIVAFLGNLLLKVLRIARKARIFISLILLFGYCLITGASTPVVRATIMGSIFLLAYFFKREADVYNSLSIAMLVILLINPRQLFNIGFQLSFTSVFAIIWLYPKIRLLLRLDSLKQRPLRYFSESLLVSLSAWLATAGIVAFYFKLFSPVTVLANIIIVPLATLLTLCGFSLILAGLFIPLLAQPFALAIQALAITLLQVNALLLRLPFACFSLP